MVLTGNLKAEKWYNGTVKGPVLGSDKIQSSYPPVMQPSESVTLAIHHSQLSLMNNASRIYFLCVCVPMVGLFLDVSHSPDKAVSEGKIRPQMYEWLLYLAALWLKHSMCNQYKPVSTLRLNVLC